MTRAQTSPFTVDGQLCVALYSASRAMTAAYREPLAALGLTYTQYAVMLALWERDPLPMRDLSASLHLDSATLSPVLRRMERDGLVTRHRVPQDERQVELSCTDRGRALRSSARDVQMEVERRTGLSGSELASLRDDLHQLADRLRDGADED